MEFKPVNNKDLRHYVIAPIRCLKDDRLKPSELKLLLFVCSYCDRTGVTWVSQERLAVDYGASRQFINKTRAALKKYGYWVYAKKRYKDQKTNSIKIIYDEDIKTEDEAYSNLPVWQQMEHIENNQVVQGDQVQPKTGQMKPPEVAGDRYQVKPPEVARGETPRGCIEHHKNNIYINNIVKPEKRIVIKFLEQFKNLGQSLGQVRTYSLKDIEVMSNHIANGLTEIAWLNILDNHLKYCREHRRPIAYSIGYFKEPIAKAINKSQAPAINKKIKELANKFKA